MEFDEYVRRERRALLRFATMLTGRAWLAEDLLADVLAHAFERWERIRQVDQPNAYVRRMIVNAHISWHRRRRRLAFSVELEAQPEGPTAGDHADGYAERAAMIARLQGLAPRQRAAVVLRYYLQLTDAEIADELGCSQSTVRSQIARALAALRIHRTESTAPRPAARLEAR
jgi:RNA polymerase sigma-70 factor (sigma-E family)